MERRVNLCDSCIHRPILPGWYDGDKGPPPCDAYRGGIPVEIWNGKDHRQPLPGDHGVQYETKPGRERLLDRWLQRRDREDVE